MNKRSPVLRWALFLGMICVCAPSLFAEACRVLVLSPSSTTTGFPAAGISTRLQGLLLASGRYTEVVVTYQTISRDASYATSLLGAVYVPPYRQENLSLIQNGNWTHVVMIDRPFNYAAAPELHYVAVNALAKIISAAGAQPVLMMPWVDQAAINSFPVNNSLVREYAYRVGDGVRDGAGNSVPVVPAGVAWSSLAAAHRGTVPGQPLYGVALNANGEFTAAAALYGYLTGDNAKTDGYAPVGLTTTTRDAIADHVMAVLASEAGAVRYSGEFQSGRLRFWNGTTAITHHAEGTSTEEAIRDQLVEICAADGMPQSPTDGVFVNNVTAGKTPSNLVFGRWNFLATGSTSHGVPYYDSSLPPSTMVAGIDRQWDDISNGPAGAAQAEYWAIFLYQFGAPLGWNYLPYHLLWVRAMYDLNIPIDSFNVHAPDWQFAATASALYTLRSGGRNGVYPAVAGRVHWSPKLRTHRFAWQTMQMAWESIYEMARLQPAPDSPERPYGLDRIIDAEYFSNVSGPVAVVPHPVETFQIQDLQDGDWTSYRVDFGTPAPTALSLVANVAASAAGAQVELRTGSPTGTLLGTVDIPATGGAGVFQEVRGMLAPGGLAGAQELFLVYRLPAGGQLAVDWFRIGLLARVGESVWIQPAGGGWSDGANWWDAVPDAPGQTARFSLEIPGGYAVDTVVTISGTRTLGTLHLGHGVGTVGGMRLQADGTASLRLQNGALPGVVLKTAGGEDTIAVPVHGTGDLQINNRTAFPVNFQAPITGQPAVYPFGLIQFSGTNYDLGRVGYGMGTSQPDSQEPNSQFSTVTWSASGTFRNLSIPLFTTWNFQGGEVSNLGWTDIGNDGLGGTGNATFNLNGGVFRHASTLYLRLGQRSSCTTAINLNGGIFETQTFFTKTLATTTITFNGGLLRYTGTSDVASLFNSGTHSPAITRVGAGGARLEIVEDRTVTLSNPLAPVAGTQGGVEKSGGGTLVLTGSNAFVGPVVVNGGVLRATGPFSLGGSRHFTVGAGATLSVPGPGVLELDGGGSGWTGAGTLEGGLAAAFSTVNLTEGTLHVTGGVSLYQSTLAFVPQVGQVVVQSGGLVELLGTLTLEMRAPSQAIPAGGTVTLFSGTQREGEFSDVLGAGLWTPSYTATGMVLTARVNIPGVNLLPLNGGQPAPWGETVELSAVATDPLGVAQVEFYANGRKIGVGVEGPAGTYTFAWQTGSWEAGTYLITTRVTNVEGLVLESPAQTLVVRGSSGPAATWTNPAGGNWSEPQNWMDGVLADAFSPARFDAQDIPSGITTIHLDAPRTVSKIFAADAVAATSGTLRIVGSRPLTISGGAAEVNVSGTSSLEMAAPVTAPIGFTKTGSGTLTLATANGGLLGKTKAAEGTLALTDGAALGGSTLTLTGGVLSFPAALSLAGALQVESGTTSTAVVSAPVSFLGSWTNAAEIQGASLLLQATGSNANITLANTITLPNVDLHLSGFDNTVHVTGTLAARNFTFYGKAGSPNRSLTVSFSGNAEASCSGTLTALNDGGTLTLRVADQARVMLPAFATSQRCHFQLNGGVLTAGRLALGASSFLYANGGTLRAMVGDPLFVTSASGSREIRVQTGGLILDTNGWDVGVNTPLTTATTPDGGVTKMGLGMLTITGTNLSWRGPTNVQAGTLKLGAGSSLSSLSRVYAISAGAMLDIASSATPALTMATSTNVLSGGGILKGSLVMTSGTVTVVAGQPLTVTGSAALGGKLVVTGTLPGAGDYGLLNTLSVSGTFAANPTLPTAPAGFTRELIYEASRVLLRVTGPGEAWLAANAPGGAFDQDLDGNGWSLLQEYALGVSPGSATQGKIVGGLSGEGKPQIGFGYNTGASDVTIRVQSSSDLVNWTTLLTKPAGATTAWTPNVSGVVILPGATSSGIQQVLVTSPDSLPSKTFLRVSLTRARQ